jgi:hypothetical protein
MTVDRAGGKALIFSIPQELARLLQLAAAGHFQDFPLKAFCDGLETY